jgi:hypothetical protein
MTARLKQFIIGLMVSASTSTRYDGYEAYLRQRKPIPQHLLVRRGSPRSDALGRLDPNRDCPGHRARTRACGTTSPTGDASGPVPVDIGATLGTVAVWRDYVE